MASQKRAKPEFGRGSGKSDPIDVELGARIRALRIARGLSQQQVATKVGVTFQQLQKYEHGANRISVATLLRLCDAMEVSAAALIAELCGSPPEPKKQEGKSAERQSLFGSRALGAVQSAPVRSAVIGLLTAVVAAEN